MTVTELRELLQSIENDGNGGLDVVATYNYGDYWRTTVAETISNAEVGKVTYSSYHSMDKVVDDSEDEDDTLAKEGTDEIRRVIILN